MNKVRRAQIEKIKTMLEQVNDMINDVMIDEDSAFNNLSDGLQCTMRGEQMENNVSEMEEAMDNINEAIDNLTNIE